jgi:hypothetical protein
MQKIQKVTEHLLGASNVANSSTNLCPTTPTSNSTSLPSNCKCEGSKIYKNVTGQVPGVGVLGPFWCK